MGDGKHCPSCGIDIGVWPILLAGFPNRIRCPGCGARLAYRGTLAVNAVLAAALIVIVTMSYGLFAGRPVSGPTWAVVALIAWIPVELLVARFLRSRRTLILARGGRRKAVAEAQDPSSAAP